MLCRFACLFTLLTGSAQADALDRLLSGTWGSPLVGELACAENSKHPSLPEPDLLRFSYDIGIWFPPETWTDRLDYRILGRGEDWLLLQIPNEFREFNGKPIVWRLKFTSPDRFVWLIEGSLDSQDQNPQIRCGGRAAIS